MNLCLPSDYTRGIRLRSALLTRNPPRESFIGTSCSLANGIANDRPPLAHWCAMPRPPRLAVSAFQAIPSDCDRALAMMAGTPPMPALGKLLSPARVKALIALIRLLGGRAN